MKKKVSLKKIVIATSIIIAVASLVIFDHNRVQRDFRQLGTDLMRIRLKSVTENKPLIVKFDGFKVAVLDFPNGSLLETLKYSTISKVMYDTTIGNNMIVFYNGTTSMHNKRIHGGEIELKSWFGIKKFIRVNCAGLVEEGRYPEKPN